MSKRRQTLISYASLLATLTWVEKFAISRGEPGEQGTRANRSAKVTKGCRGKHKGQVYQRYGKLGGNTAVSPSRYRSTDAGWFRPCSRERHPLLPRPKDQRDFQDRRLSTFDFATYVFRGVYQLVLSLRPKTRLPEPPRLHASRTHPRTER